MTERDIVALIGSLSDHPAWSAFVREMESKSYGYEPLTSAWGFFQKGFDAAARATSAIYRTEECEHGTRGCRGRGEKHSCSR